MKVVKTHLPSEEAPIEWATMADGVLYTAQIPIREDGSIESGSIEAQADLTLSNLKRTLEAAGGTLDDVTQVLVYLTGKEHFQDMNAVYRRYFSKPFPNRA
ncbi:MAG: RidA family protein, partial [Rhizobiaceae bacterium]|nr:RidA family protein [Rhizobiaceae bacterium]